MFVLRIERAVSIAMIAASIPAMLVFSFLDILTARCVAPIANGCLRPLYPWQVQYWGPWSWPLYAAIALGVFGLVSFFAGLAVEMAFYTDEDE